MIDIVFYNFLNSNFNTVQFRHLHHLLDIRSTESGKI